jgi:hypothetical protein
VLPLRVAAWCANDLWRRTRHLPQPRRPIEFFAYNFFDCRHRGSLAASAQVNHAPRVRHPPSIFSTYAPRLGERVLLINAAKEVFTSRSWVTSHKRFCWYPGSRSSHRDWFPPTHLPRFRARCARAVLATIAVRMSRAIFSSSSRPAHNSRVQFRIMARCLRLLRKALLSTLLFVRVGPNSVHTVSSELHSAWEGFHCHHRSHAIFDLLRLSSPLSTSAGVIDPRHLLQCYFALQRPLREVTTPNLLSFMGPFYL